MRLKTGLWSAFLSLGLLPLAVSGAIMLIVAACYEQSIESRYGVEADGLAAIMEPEVYFSDITDDTYSQLMADSINSVENLSNINYLKEVDEKLAELDSYLVVEKYGKVKYCKDNTKAVSIFFGEDYFEGEFTSYIPEWGEGISSTVRDNGLLVKKLEVSYADGTKGHTYIITDIGDTIIEINNFMTYMLIISTVIYFLVCGAVILWIYRDIAVPIRYLKEVTKNVKEGYLDFEIGSSKVTEMNEIYQEFEKMRQKLKIQAEEKIQDDKENKELISNISHDLKTPITAVKGYVEGIIDGVADTPERMDKYIRTIYTKANEMDRLINELTFYSKIDTNRIPYTFTKINVTNYFNDCIEEKQLDLEAKNIQLAYFNYVPEDVMIIADAEQLSRVINNIIGNSIKYMDKDNGYINVRIKDADDFIQVETEDNGKGIGEKELPCIFDRFYRTDASRNSSTGGSGIGLSIVKKIVEDHGGEIWATSKESIGTVMYFTLRKYQEVQNNE